VILSDPHSARFAGTTDVVVIGAGHAGLGASYMLGEHGVDHVVLERGDIANSWRKERWNSLKLLTPNWQTRLPGYYYAGDNPDGYMNMSELVGFMEDYAEHSSAPIRTNTMVTSVSRSGDAYSVKTNRGEWTARSVVIASGACNIASVPAVAANVPEHITQLTPHQYRSPEQVADGGVLIVGASATGMQLADELLQAGREVTMAVGEHVRMPRRYRGHDILYWMAQCGILNERYDEVEDISRGRRLPSSQLVGSNEKPILDLNSLRDQGAKITGRFMGVNNGVAQFSGSVRNVCALADLKMKRLLKTIDAAIPVETNVGPAETFEDTRLDDAPALTINLENKSIRTIIWATGFRPDYSWLDVPVLDRKGHLKHDGGIVESPGMYVLGLPLMRRRKSSFIFGIEDDARDITDHLVNYLNTDTRNNSHGIYQHNSGETSFRRSA
jgi:putative flavoprotein involved in K+ transport